ncbi:MAG: signal peptidase I [Lachnospiraceae bacterium]|nr:signal peptidase I [Lachnospiraceae bacterium]
MKIMKELFTWILYILIIIGLTIVINMFVGQRTHVKGYSMEPTLHNNDNLIVDKISYRFREPSRFDIVVFPFDETGQTYYIKRIIGLPGELIQIIDGQVYINGMVLAEDYGNDLMDSPGIAAQPILLGEDEYFVLGDNRNRSSDSRDPHVGVQHRNDMLGRAFLRMWPLSDFGLIRHE